MQIIRSIAALGLLAAGLALAEPPRVPIVRVEGQWDSNFGRLTLSQDGTHVEGTYTCCAGRLHGSLRAGRTLDLEWQDEVYGRGWVRFVVAPDGRSMSGTWALRGERLQRGEWNATRQAEPTPPAGEASHWGVAGYSPEAGRLVGQAVLYRDGEHVEGTLDGVYRLRIQGALQALPVVNDLSGTWVGTKSSLTWRNPSDGSQGVMSLVQDGADSLVGRWLSSDGRSSGSISFFRIALAPAAPDRAPRLVEQVEATARGRRHLAEAKERYDRQEYEAAARSYERAIRDLSADLDPNTVALAQYGLGLALSRLGRHADARRAFEAVLAFGERIDASLLMLARAALD